MDKDKLLKIAIFTALIGLLLLFLINMFIDVKPTPVSKVDESYLGKTIKVEGLITKKSNIGNFTMFYVDNSSLEFVVFSKIDVSKGDKVSVTGKVEEYKDGIQVRVDKLSLI